MDDATRSYGLNTGCLPKGVPKAKPLGEGASVAPTAVVDCPNCGCKELMEIELEVDNRILTSGAGTAFYVGCPACPWASPMLAVANQSTASEA
jgi:hypothetical protein